MFKVGGWLCRGIPNIQSSSSVARLKYDDTLKVAKLPCDRDSHGPNSSSLCDLTLDLTTSRSYKLNMLEVNLEIINLTMDKPAVSSASSIKTPESKPKKRQRDPEVVTVDSL